MLAKGVTDRLLDGPDGRKIERHQHARGRQPYGLKNGTNGKPLHIGDLVASVNQRPAVQGMGLEERSSAKQ